METKQLGTTEQDLALAGELLRQGQLVAFPTETVYGLGADALNETAVAQIYAAKGRPSDNPLIVHVAEKADIAPLVQEIPEKAKKLFDRFFPGPLTVILPKAIKSAKWSAADWTRWRCVCRRTRWPTDCCNWRGCR